MIDEIKNTIRDIPNFPKEGIVFKDITPILKKPEMCKAIVDLMVEQLENVKIDAIAGIESRGFLFGMMLANALQKPFIPIRKAGKLPFTTLQKTYALEYGTATIEMHIDAVGEGQQILIHDDLLATGGTVEAAAQLITSCGATVSGFSFLIALEFLGGNYLLEKFNAPIFTCVCY